MTTRLLVLVVATVVAAAGCTDDADPTPTDAAPTGAATTSAAGTPSTSPADTATEEATAAGPSLAPVPPATRGWASTIGLPVVGAVRTSTPLARLAGVPVDERVAICTQVAVELDSIASPQVLSGLAVTADAETATLLVGDLRAKADLLAVCDRDGPEVERLVEEVAATHEVATAWLRAIGSGS